MKKLIAALLALSLVFALTTTALAEEAAPAFTNGVQFNMDLPQVRELVSLPGGESEADYRGPLEFWELEYEHARDDNGFAADITYLFVGNGLVAIHYDMADGTDYEAVKAAYAGKYGEAVPFDAAKIGNAKFAIDDDGDLRNCREMIEGKGVTVVLEKDHEGDVDVTVFDPTAAYINN